MKRIPAQVTGDAAVVRPYGEDDFIYLQCGYNIVIASGVDMTGKLTADFPVELGEFLREVFNWVLINRAALFTVHRASYAAHVHLWERLVLPCRDWDGSDRLVVYVKPRELRADLLDAVLDASADIIIATGAIRDGQGRVVDARIITANRRAAEATGLPIEALVDGLIRETLPCFAGDDAWERYLRVMETGRSDVFETHLGPEGAGACVRVTASPIAGGFMITGADVSDLRQALVAAEEARREAEATRDEMRRLSVMDPLTGLLNRRGFEEAMRAHRGHLRRFGIPVSVVAVDLDHFKAVNDTFGHAAGDWVLMALAALFREETRVDTDRAGRIGGEEFVLLLPGTPIDGAIGLAERLRTRIRAEALDFEGTFIRVTASFGVSEFELDEEPEAALRRADEALYEAKRTGRDRTIARPSPPRERVARA